MKILIHFYSNLPSVLLPEFLSEMVALALTSQTRLKLFMSCLANKMSPSGFGITYSY